MDRNQVFQVRVYSITRDPNTGKLVAGTLVYKEERPGQEVGTPAEARAGLAPNQIMYVNGRAYAKNLDLRTLGRGFAASTHEPSPRGSYKEERAQPDRSPEQRLHDADKAADVITRLESMTTAFAEAREQYAKACCADLERQQRFYAEHEKRLKDLNDRELRYAAMVADATRESTRALRVTNEQRELGAVEFETRKPPDIARLLDTGLGLIQSVLVQGRSSGGAHG